MKKNITGAITVLAMAVQLLCGTGVYAETKEEQAAAAPSSYTAESYAADSYIDYDNNENDIWKLYYRKQWDDDENTPFTPEQKKKIDISYGFGWSNYAFMVNPDEWINPVDGKTPAYISKTHITTGYWNNQYTMTKGFTAPRDGVVRVYNAAPLRSVDYVDGENHSGVYIRITRNTIKNAVLDYTQIVKGEKNCTTDENNITTYNMEPFELEIKAGETLYFEVRDKDCKTSPWTGIVQWNPCVSYILEEDYELPESYRASDYYTKVSAENGPWACQYYTNGTGYADMKQTCSWVAGHSDDGTGQGTAWIEQDGNGKYIALSAAVGKYYMNPERNVAGEYDPKVTVRAVRTFTAPHSGKITITADDGNGNSRILGTSKSSEGAYVRVMYKGRMVWPMTSGLNGERIPAGDGTNAGYLDADAFTLDVKKGDKIYFEVHNGRIFYNYWEKRTYWNPVVTYERRSCYADSVTVKDSEGRELKEFDAVVASGSCTVSARINAVYRDLGDVTLMAAIYDAEGKLISAGYDYAQLNMDDSKTFSIDLEGTQAAEGGCIKLFVFDNAENMIPLRISDASGALMKADDSNMPTYTDVNGDFCVPYTGVLKRSDGTNIAVTAGEILSFDNAETLHYTSLREDTVTVNAITREADGALMFEADSFLRGIGVTPQRNGDFITGTFNGAEIKIPLSGDVAYYDEVNIELDAPILADGDGVYVSADYFDCFYGVTVNGSGATATVYRPKQTVDYDKVLSELPSGERVVDGDAIYDISAGSEGKYEMKAYDTPDGKFDRVLRLTTEEKPLTSYSYRAGGPGTLCDYSRGDVLVMSFWARATRITDDTGAAYVGVTLEESQTWRKDFSSDVQVTSEWKKYYIPVEAGADVKAGDAWLGFHCGFKPQTVEIADFSLLNYKKTVELAHLKDIEKTDTYKGREKDALWRTQAQKRIEKYRTNEFTVKVTDFAGNTLSGVTVTAEMTKSAFMFGTEQAGYDNEKISPYIKKYFNGITASYAKLGMYNEQNVTNVLNFAKENGMSSRGHALVYDHPIFMWNENSAECQKWDMYRNVWTTYKTYDDAKNKFDDYIKDRMNKFQGFTQWDVLNEPDSVYAYRQRFGNEFAAEWFKTFNSVANGSKAYINSCTFSGYPSQNGSAQNFADLITSLKECGAPIDGGGIQCHLRGLIYPQTFYNQVDAVAKTVDEVSVTEFDIQAMTSDNLVKQEDAPQLESDLVRDVLTAVYSNPKAVGFYVWGICDRNQDHGLLLDEDYNEKPTLEMWKNLVMGEWRTKVSGVTDGNGEFTFRGHLGDYDISVYTDSAQKAMKSYTLTIDEKGYAEAKRRGTKYVFMN